MTVEEKFLKSLRFAVENGASDVHIYPDQPVVFRINMVPKKEELSFTREETVELQELIFSRFISDYRREKIEETFRRYWSVDFSIRVEGVSYRVNLSLNNEGRSFVLRQIGKKIPPLSSLGYSPKVLEGINSLIISPLSKPGKYGGLFILTGATNSGKSTTIASIVYEIAKNSEKIIETYEDPIEYVYPKEGLKSIIVQNEYQRDFPTFQSALHASLRKDLDIIVVGEIRQPENLDLVLKAAESGYFVFTTLHAGSAVDAVTRLVSMGENKEYTATRLSRVLTGIISQRLVKPEKGNSLVLIYEALFANNAVRELINKLSLPQIYAQIDNSIPYSSSYEKVISGLVKRGILHQEEGRSLSRRKDIYKAYIEEEGGEEVAEKQGSLGGKGVIRL